MDNHEQKAADKQAPQGVEDAAKEAWFHYEHREGNLHQNCFVDGFDKGVEWKERQLPGVEEWVSVKDELPPFGERLWFRGVVSWKKENSVKHFEDELTTKTEELEYGQTGWLLKDNTDFVVTDSVFPFEDLASEYVTHWRKLPEPPRV